MAIVAADIVWRLSGGAANTDPAASLGGAMGTAAGAIITPTKTFNSIFDDLSGAETAAGDVNYRCIYATNTHGTLGLTTPKLVLSANVANANDMIDVGLDLAGVNGVADTIVNEATAPDPAVTFSHACVDYANGLALSAALAASEKVAVWIRRTVTAGMGADDDENWTTEIQGDSAA